MVVKENSKKKSSEELLFASFRLVVFSGKPESSIYLRIDRHDP
jgi:hypothetical protein